MQYGGISIDIKDNIVDKMMISRPYRETIIAKCIKCNHVSSTNLDALANHTLYGGEEWSSTVRAEAQAIIDVKYNRISKKRRLNVSNRENANTDHVQV